MGLILDTHYTALNWQISHAQFTTTNLHTDDEIWNLQSKEYDQAVNPLRLKVITFGQMYLHLPKCNYICKIATH